MSAAENESLVRAYIEEVWNKGNLDYIHEVWAADRVIECRAGWVSNRQFCPNGRFAVGELIAQGNKVVVRWTFQGTRPNGASHGSRTFTMTGISIWRIQDGRFVDSYFESEGPGIYD